MSILLKTSFASLAVLALSTTSLAAHADDTKPVETTPRITVVLHADSSHATLERRDGVMTPAGLPVTDANLFGLAQWSPQCTAPCELALDPKFTYRVAGDGLVPSDSFVLRHDQTNVLIDAKMGSSTERLGGLGMAVLGAGGLVLGASAIAVSPILAKDDVGSPTLRTGVLVSGIGVTALSAALFSVGLYLWNHNETQLSPASTQGFAF